jgi:hypothetical protein
MGATTTCPNLGSAHRRAWRSRPDSSTISGDGNHFWRRSVWHMMSTVSSIAVWRTHYVLPGGAMSTIPKFRIDVNIHTRLMNSASERPRPPLDKGMSLPDPIYPRFPEKLSDPGPEAPPERREWTLSQAYRSMRGWLFPYICSRVLPGEFHPIIAYLFVEYKCNLDCWYCWLSITRSRA